MDFPLFRAPITFPISFACQIKNYILGKNSYIKQVTCFYCYLNYEFTKIIFKNDNFIKYRLINELIGYDNYLF